MKIIQENFEIGDLQDIISKKIHIDEFSSKLGKDDENIVISFLILDKTAANDLVSFLETGYDFILDADISESEIKPGNYLVFVEILRRHRIIDQIFKILSDLEAASEINMHNYSFKYMNGKEYYPLTAENLKKYVPLYPKAYRDKFNQPITNIKKLAGLKNESKIITDPLLLTLQHGAGII